MQGNTPTLSLLLGCITWNQGLRRQWNAWKDVGEGGSHHPVEHPMNKKYHLDVDMWACLVLIFLDMIWNLVNGLIGDVGDGWWALAYVGVITCLNTIPSDGKKSGEGVEIDEIIWHASEIHQIMVFCVAQNLPIDNWHYIRFLTGSLCHGLLKSPYHSWVVFHPQFKAAITEVNWFTAQLDPGNASLKCQVGPPTTRMSALSRARSNCSWPKSTSNVIHGI